MSGRSEPIVANLFHAGSTCPFCQEAITEGQMIVTCAACGSLHHDTCWAHKGGCSSYHCDERTAVPPGSMKPEILLTHSELDRVVVPPKPARRPADEAARPFLPPQPERLSRLAVVSVALAGASGVGLLGLFSARLAPVLVLGVILCLAAIVVGVVALVLINMGRKVHGTAPAVTGVLLAAGLVIAYFIGLNAGTAARRTEHRMMFEMDESRPDEAELSRLPAAKAGALRANVVVTSRGGYLGGAFGYGSGIILKIEDKKAYVLTNRHVIGAGSLERRPSREIEVLFYNGEKSPATVEWTAPGEVDLTILSCQVLTLTKVEPPELLQGLAGQGDPVFAVGNPENLYWSYTEGIISSIRRQQLDGQEIEVYQTQTPINAGNSGGGLYSKEGTLIGINTWTKDKSVAEGLSFAISTAGFLRLLGPEERTRFLKQFSPAARPLDLAGPAEEVPPL